MTQKKVVEICYSNSMKVNRGNFEQESPFYSAKTVIEENGTPVDEVAEYARLRGIIDPLLTKQYQESKLDMAGLRVRLKDGKKYVSVSSILHPEPYTGDPEYGLRGTEIHRLVNTFITTGKWEKPEIILTKLKFEDIKYQEFFEKFKDRLDLEIFKLNVEVFHEKHLYSGELDALLIVDGIKTLVDFKTGQYDFAQLIAYYRALEDKEVKQLAVFDLKNQVLDILDLKDKRCPLYWEKFLIKRGVILGKFGI